MSETARVVACAIDDDVLIPFPEDFGIEAGVEFEVTRRADGVIILALSGKAEIK